MVKVSDSDDDENIPPSAWQVRCSFVGTRRNLFVNIALFSILKPRGTVTN